MPFIRVFIILFKLAAGETNMNIEIDSKYLVIKVTD